MLPGNSRRSAPIQGRSTLWLVGVVLCFRLAAWAQDVPAAAVTFTFDFPGSNPSHYVISVSADGRGFYTSDGKLATESESDPSLTEPFRADFTIAQATCARIFDLAKRAHYFEGDIDSKKKGLAYTGTKILTYKDAQKNTQATYNYSTVPAIQELTALLQGLSTTLEFSHRLEYDLHYQKLALDEELKRMEEASNDGGLDELAAATPVLQKIANDPSIINVSRARAQRLLARARAGGK